MGVIFNRKMNLVVVVVLLGINCALASKTHCKSICEKLECCGGKKSEENLNQGFVELKRDEARVIEVGAVRYGIDKEVKEKIVFYKNQSKVSLTSALNDVGEKKTEKSPIQSFISRKESKQQLLSKNQKIWNDSIKETYNPKEFEFEDMKIATKKNKNKKASLLLIEEENMEGQWDADQFDSPKNIDKFEFPRSETSQERLMQIYKERLMEVRSASSASDESVEEDEADQEFKSEGDNESRIEDATTAIIFNLINSKDLLDFKEDIKDKINEYASVEKTETENV